MVELGQVFVDFIMFIVCIRRTFHVTLAIQLDAQHLHVTGAELWAMTAVFFGLKGVL